jgi:hypothetical protein
MQVYCCQKNDICRYYIVIKQDVLIYYQRPQCYFCFVHKAKHLNLSQTINSEERGKHIIKNHNQTDHTVSAVGWTETKLWKSQ